VRTRIRLATAATLAAIGALHVLWGRGSSFPFRNRDALADAVAGRRSVPSPIACNAVAGALWVATALVADVPLAPRRVRTIGRLGVATVLATRGAAGMSGRTDALSPGSTSPKFRRLDRNVYAPLCIALAAGALIAGSRKR
jgi:hypothetical protein